MGQETSKVLVELLGKPLIFYILERLKRDLSEVEPIIVVGYKHAAVIDALGKDYRYALQSKQLGTAHAVWSAEPHLNLENTIVLYGDMPFIRTKSLKRLIRHHNKVNAHVSIFTTQVPHFSGMNETFSGFGRIIRDNFGNIIKITEYKDASIEEKQITEVNPSIYIFKTKWLVDNMHEIQNNNAKKEYYLTDIIEIAMAQNHPINSLPIKSIEVFGVNTPEHLQQAEYILKSKNLSW